MLTQEAPSTHTCTPRLAMKGPSSPILGPSDSGNSAPPPYHHLPDMDSADGLFVDVASVDSGKFLPAIAEDHTRPTPVVHGLCKLSSENHLNPTSVEAKPVIVGDEKECVSVKQDSCIKSEECALSTCGDKPTDEYEMERPVDDDNQAVRVHVDVNACISHMEKLSANASGVQEFYEGRDEVSPTNGDMQSTVLPLQVESNDGVLKLCNGNNSKEQGLVPPPPRKPAAWHTPDPKSTVVAESEFIMEASSWPTLAEAHHAKPAEARASPSQTEKNSISSPAQKVLSSQENSVEAPKHVNSNPPQPGSKYRSSSYKKGHVQGNNKPSFPATENIPVPPMGVHVPSANMFNPDQFMNGNGRVVANNVFPGPHQAPANGALYHHNRGSGPTPFVHNSAIMIPYGRGHPGWQHHGRGYSDANYKYSGFSPAYGQQHFGPRHMHPPMAPFMNTNGVHYNYPNYPNYPVGDMSYMPSAFSPGYNYAIPYFGPCGPPGELMQEHSSPSVRSRLQRQIEYYFSKENLIKDSYLKSQMDEEDFVPVSLIAGFPRVLHLTSDYRLILDALKNSSVVEVKNDKLRSREWRRRLHGTLQTHGVERLESLSNTGARDQGSKESRESGLDR